MVGLVSRAVVHIDKARIMESFIGLGDQGETKLPALDQLRNFIFVKSFLMFSVVSAASFRLLTFKESSGI